MTAVCTRCQTPLAANVLEGLCPRCLLLPAFELERIEDAATTAPASFTAPAVAELAPLFPQLEIQELLGQGGMGAVYRARQVKLDRLVALKVLPRAVATDPGFAERFTREARALARLNHPHIVGVHDFGEVGGLYYLVMEFVDGVNLRQALAAGKLEPAQALKLVGDLCAALQYAHEMGVVHRDIKPENILLDKQGRVKVADFGLAKLVGPTQPNGRLTASRQAMGTPHYMAPEQWEKPLEVDHRADIFSLGVVFYELLTGELPLGRFPPPSQKAGVDVRLDPVVLRAMEKQPEQRYQQMSEMKTAVEAAGQMPAPRPKAPAAEPAALNWKLEALLTAGMVLLVGAVFGIEPFLPEKSGKETFYGILFWVIGIQLVFELVAFRYVRRLCGLAFLGFVVSYFVYALAGQDTGWGKSYTVYLAIGFAFAVYRIFQCFQRGSSDEEEETDEESEPVPGLTAQEEALRRLLLSSTDDLSGCLSVLPNIEMLAPARKNCRAAADDRILGVLDFSGGEAEAALLFGCSALYWRNGDDTPDPGVTMLPYSGLAGQTPVNHGDAVYLGSNLIICPNPDESEIDCEALVSLLVKVRDLMAPAAGEGDSPDPDAGEEKVEPDGERLPGLTAREEAMRQILLRSQDGVEGLSVLPEIDNDVLRTARKECRVAPDDRIVGVVDFSGGEGQAALLFGCTGLYWRNGDDTPHPEWGWIDYAMLAGQRIVNHGDVVLVGQDQFICPDPDNSGIDCEALVNLLIRVRDAMAP